ISEFLNFDGEKLDAIYNGVSDHFFEDATRVQINIAQIRYKLPKAYIFLLGNTDPKKNIGRTLKAYELYRDNAAQPLPLVIADLSEENLIRLVHENEIDVEILPYIHLTGYVPNPDLPVLYKLSSLFLYVSNRESFGIPILEAMASGIPVITSNTSSMPEVAGKAAALANPFDFKDIAAKMVAVMEDQLWRTILIRKGLAHVQKFRWMETAEQILQMYTSVVQPQTQKVAA
ncbi:MAG: glycosyltransferase family 4 protein, partial [Cytophagales bacterium]|nr:glycosyltransferase family 4 protein [Cytophagales bacterium]